MSEYFLKVMPDYYSSGLWDQNDEGCMTELRDHIEVNEEVILLENDLLNWNKKYDETISWCTDHSNSNFDWVSFHKEGLALAQRIKKIMGPNGKVIYFKERNRNTGTKSETILIQD